MRIVAIALAVCGALAGEAWAQGWESALSRTHPFNVPTPLADSRDPFVGVPARIGFYAGMAVGLVPGLMAGVPLALFDQATTGRTSQFSANVIQAPAVYSGVAMQYMAGAPFFAGKVMFWDIPRRLLYGAQTGQASR